MPRKDYKTITVKVDCFNQFIKAKDKTTLDNSEFLSNLLKINRKLNRQKKRLDKLEGLDN